MSFTTQVPIRWVDLDAQGHVNNAVIPEYALQAWVAFLTDGGRTELLNELEVLKAQVQFLAPIPFSTTPITVELSVLGVTGFRARVDFVMKTGARRVALVRATLGFAEADESKSLTDQQRAWFAHHIVPHGTGTQVLTEKQVSTSVEVAREKSRSGERTAIDALAALVSGEQPVTDSTIELHTSATDPFPPFPNWRVGPEAYEYDFALRYTDITTTGRISPVALFKMVAEARVRMNPQDNGKTRMEEAAEAEMVWLVVRQDAEYLAPIPYAEEPLKVRTAYARVGNTSLTLVAQIELDGEALARTTTVLVAADSAGTPIPVPDSIAEGINIWPATVAI
ncbi:MAG: acyl-[acyl-carrier-protein] thioesterase [Propionibacteriaceae bacterium]|jgi:acyl-CoA thioester hydrolase|nr:acyl-[acyl-carrier-protein] thioesterase [Propionibacteriaceae bacterium]